MYQNFAIARTGSITRVHALRKWLRLWPSSLMLIVDEDDEHEVEYWIARNEGSFVALAI